jgi:hypothetical protein
MYQKNELEIIKFANSDNAQFIFLKNHLREFYTQEVLNWQYPNDNNSTGLYFVKDKEGYIASQGMLPIYLTVLGKPLLTAKSETTFILPSYRGTGIFEKLYEHTISASEKDGVEMIWGFTALSIVWKKMLKFDVFDGVIHETILQTSLSKDLLNIFNSQSSTGKFKMTLKALVAAFNKIELRKRNKSYQAKELDIKNPEVQENVIEIYQTWQRNHPDNISIALTKEFLNWRLINNPKITYKFVGIYNSEELVGVGIVNINGSKAYLTDFIVSNDNLLSFCLTELLRYVKNNYSSSSLVYWGSSLNKYTNSIHTFFKSKGAFEYPNNFMNFVVKFSKNNNLGNIEIAKYCLNGLWTEGFNI